MMSIYISSILKSLKTIKLATESFAALKKNKTNDLIPSTSTSCSIVNTNRYIEKMKNQTDLLYLLKIVK